MKRRFGTAASSLVAVLCALTQPAGARDTPLAAQPPSLVPLYRGAPGERPPERLDGVAAVSYALGHAPALLAQRAQILSLDSTFTRARAGEYPSTAGQLQNQISRSHNSGGQFAQFGVSPTNNFSQNTAQLSTTYNLYNGTQRLATQQAREQTRAARFELARQEQQTTVSVVNAFYGLAAQHGIVTLDENDLRYQQALLESARASERVGRVAGVDVLRAQVAVARSTSTLVQARTDEANAREALAVQIGAPTATTFDVPAVLPEPPSPNTSRDVLTTMAKMNRPEIAAARATLDVSKLADAAVDNDLRPTVQANASFGSQVSPTNFVLQQQQIDASNAAAIASYNSEKLLFPYVNFPPPVLLPAIDRRQPGFWQFSILSTFSIPLFDYGQRAAAHHAARAQVDSSLASLYNAYDAVESDVDASSRNLAAASQRLELSKLSAQAARETARIAQLQYKSGLISFTDATQTEQTALAAENDLVAARANYVTALIKLRVALAPPNPAAAADLRGL